MASYFVKIGEETIGPFSENEIKAMLRDGKIAGEHLISTDRQNWSFAGELATAAPTMPMTPSAEPPVENHLVWSILVTLLCCWPLGIGGIVKSIEVNQKLAEGDYKGAREASEKAKNWCIASASSGAVILFFWFVFTFFEVILSV